MQLIENQKQTNHFPESIVLDFFKQITSGTAYIHSKKILPRDLKPSNIFISSEKHLKTGDFGISKKHNNTMSMASTKVAWILAVSAILNCEFCKYKNDYFVNDSCQF